MMHKSMMNKMHNKGKGGMAQGHGAMHTMPHFMHFGPPPGFMRHHPHGFMNHGHHGPPHGFFNHNNHYGGMHPFPHNFNQNMYNVAFEKLEDDEGIEEEEEVEAEYSQASPLQVCSKRCAPG